MKIEDQKKALSLKHEMQIAMEAFEQKYKKTTKGIRNLYTEAMLTNDPKEVSKLYTRFFGYLQKSKNAKDKWSE